MAKNKARRKMGRYIRGEVDEEMSIGTLASKDVAIAVFDETVNERTFISSLVATYALLNRTPGSTVGPLMVGVAHSDYTSAEIEAWIESTGSWNEGDLVQSREVGRRLIKKVGVFPDDGGAAVSVASVLNDGKPIKTKLGWILLQGQTLNAWAYNLGSSPYATTVPLVHIQGHANLWPR